MAGLRMKVENGSGSVAGPWMLCSGCRLELGNPLSSWLLEVGQELFGLERGCPVLCLLGHPGEGLQSELGLCETVPGGWFGFGFVC